MPKFHSRLFPSILLLFIPLGHTTLFAQSAPKAAAAPTAEQALDLAQHGRCKEAIPTLKRALSATNNSVDLRKQAAVLGLRCSLATDDRDSAVTFLQQMHKQFPKDPDILYMVVHAYSDLSTRSSEDLARTAPQSTAALKLAAEAYEMQGNWDEAQHQYETILKRDPQEPGIHFLLGRALLSRPNPTPEMLDRARDEFQKELQVNPTNAGAHYVLGELARKKENCDEAISHFAQATRLDNNFAEAYLGWGYCLTTQKKYEDAVAKLRIAERLMPGNPAVHFALGTALNFAGQKQEAQKEFAIHRQLTAAAAPTPPPQ